MKTLCTTLLAAGCLSLVACESLPGSKKEQGAVIGGVSGAAVGYALGDSALAALIGGALGAGGGYLIGAELEKLDGDESDAEAAREAAREANEDPAKPSDVENSSTADLNRDGFVTFDEVVAMSDADLTDDEIVARLEATGQVFELTEQQEDRLIDAGVSPRVVDSMERINQPGRERVGLENREVLGSSPRT